MQGFQKDFHEPGAIFSRQQPGLLFDVFKGELHIHSSVA
jgi:hypothetical protein